MKKLNTEFQKAKPWYLSSGVVGGLATSLLLVLGSMFSFDVDQDMINQSTLFFTNLIGLVTAILATRGRAKANTIVTLTKKEADHVNSSPPGSV